MPERHNAVRKINNLFESCLKTFNDLKNLNNEKIKPSVSITVSEENCSNIDQFLIILYLNVKLLHLNVVL